MAYYYVTVQSKNHAYFLDSRFSYYGVKCEIVYLPVLIVKDSCGTGIRFSEEVFPVAATIIKTSGLKQWSVYKEVPYEEGFKYEKVQL